ncbi:MAG: DUF2752 domain-containing protein [Acidobacteriota bacterium]
MRLEQSDERSSPVGLILGGAGLLTALLTAAWLRIGLPWPRCGLRTLTGVPCPTCGGTRMFGALLRGEWLVALASNPLLLVAIVVLAIGCVAWAARFLTGRPGLRLVVEPREGRRFALVMLGLVLANWAWLVATDRA